LRTWAYAPDYSYSSGIPSELPSALIPNLQTYISTSDIPLLAQALNTLALLLELSPAKTFAPVERELLAEVYKIAPSPLVSGPALEALFNFLTALVHADNQIATHLVPNLVIIALKAPKADANPANVAKCVACIVKGFQGVAAGVIAEYSKNIKVSAGFYLRPLLSTEPTCVFSPARKLNLLPLS
jgi:cullin-associated NEDD8-dissociated protein 1